MSRRRSCCCAAGTTCTCFPSCPPTAYCESFGFGAARCNAPADDPCCKTYSMSASFSMIPYGCCNLDQFADPLCVTPTPTIAAIYDCNDGSTVSSFTCHVDSYIPTGSGTINCTFPTLNLGGGRCDIDGNFLPNVTSGISTTNTFSCLTGGTGYLSTEFKITVTRSCNLITVNLLYSYYLDAGTSPCLCNQYGPALSSYTLEYEKVPGTGSCNIDGTYTLTNKTCNISMSSWEMYRDPVTDPPVCPSDCCNSTIPTNTVVTHYSGPIGNVGCNGSLAALQSFPNTLTVT